MMSGEITDVEIEQTRVLQKFYIDVELTHGEVVTLSTTSYTMLQAVCAMRAKHRKISASIYAAVSRNVIMGGIIISLTRYF